MSLAPRLTFVALALLALSGTAPAQDASTFAAVPPATIAPSVPAGPRQEATRAGIQSVVVAAEPAAPAPMRRADTKRSRTLMIIGGAALLGGAIVGDDAGQIIMLGGLGVGLYGLYLHLQ